MEAAEASSSVSAHDPRPGRHSLPVAHASDRRDDGWHSGRPDCCGRREKVAAPCLTGHQLSSLLSRKRWIGVRPRREALTTAGRRPSPQGRIRPQAVATSDEQLRLLRRLALLHLAAPGAGLFLAVLDQLLEPFEVTEHLTLDDA